MRRVALILAWCALALSTAGAAEEPAPKRWFAGDCSVLAWPTGNFTEAERARQAAAGGLSWLVVCNDVKEGALTAPGASRRLLQIRTKGVTPIRCLRWRAPTPIKGDIICIGVDPELPLPRAKAADVIDWVNRLGGATILVAPGRNLERYVATLAGFTAFEAFRNGAWHPECREGKTWDNLLAKGLRVCIVGGTSDGTSPTLGRGAVTTYVLAESNSERHVVAAIRAGNVVVAEQDKIRLDFTVDGYPPGSTVDVKGSQVEVMIHVRGREAVESVRIIGNKRIAGTGIGADSILRLRTINVRARHATRVFTLPIDRSTRYLRAVAVLSRGDCRTITNPVFLGADAPKAPPPDAREKNLQLVGAALGHLDWSDAPRAAKVVEKVLGDRVVGPSAAIFIAENYDKKARDRIRPFLKSGRSTVRTAVAYVLARTEGEAALPDILPLLQDTARGPRVYAARVLARFASRRHLPMALKTARDAWPEARRYGLAALARIPSPKALLGLRKALHERSKPVRKAAETQLCLALGIKLAHQKDFIKAFKTGDLKRRLIQKAVTRVELHPLVEQAAAEKLGEGDLARPHAGGRFRTLSVARTARPPRIDGRPGDKVWASAFEVTNFVRATGTLARHQTIIRALYDEDALYLVFRCVELHPERLVANEKSRDGRVSFDDSIDIYICPSDKRGEKNPVYYRFAVNARGVKLDEKRGRRYWNTKWLAATAVGKREWAVEVALPFSGLETKRPHPGRTRWLINVVRNRRVKPGEKSQFAPGDPRKPAEHAILKFD